MKYQYRFGTGHEDVEVDEEWYTVLRELDRQEYNSNRRETRRHVHIDAYPYVPEFYGKEDQGYSDVEFDLTALFDGSPAFEHAVSYLLPRHRDVLYRRAVLGETFRSIAESYDTLPSVICSYYQRLCERFRKHYNEWVWIKSDENSAPEGAGNITTLTSGLTKEQIMQIRAYRYAYKTGKDIARLVGVPYYRVQVCLRENPILATKCPACSEMVTQPPTGAMRVFCSHKCYLKWVRDYAFNYDVYGPVTRSKASFTLHQKMIINFYRQMYIPVPSIAKIVGVPRLHVSAYVREYPLPYTLCRSCGEKIYPQDTRKLLRYCSEKCKERYDNRMARLKKHSILPPHKRMLPTYEQLKHALDLYDAHHNTDQIHLLTAMTPEDTEDLFRFELEKRKKQYTRTKLMKKTKLTTKIVTGIITFTNALVWEPEEITAGNPPVFTVSILVPKDEIKTYEAINNAISSAIEIGSQKYGTAFCRKAKRNIPVHDGDKSSLSELYRGCWVVNASTFIPPSVCDRRVEPITERAKFKSGCPARVSLTFYPHDSDDTHGPGIGCMLGNFQKAPLQDDYSILPKANWGEFLSDFTRIYIKKE